MGTVKLCTQGLAKAPYTVEATGLPLYCVEELAYYLYENIYMIDDSLMDEKLYTWLERELGMSTLAEKLRNAQGSGIHVYNQVMTILQAADYHTKKELSDLSEKIKKLSGMQTQERLKYKADELLRNESFWAAVAEYERILGIRQNSRLPVEFYAAVWNNLGCCYAGLFLFEKAASCFESAFQFHKKMEYKERAYYARRLAAYGQEAPEELLEDKSGETFARHAEAVLKEMETECAAVCQRDDFDSSEFLKKREKIY